MWQNIYHLHYYPFCVIGDLSEKNGYFSGYTKINITSEDFIITSMAKQVEWHRLVSLDRGIKENHLIVLQEYPDVSYGAVKKVVQRRRKKNEIAVIRTEQSSTNEIAKTNSILDRPSQTVISEQQHDMTYDEWAKCHSGYSWFARIPEWIADKYGYVMEVVVMKRYSLRS